MNIHRDSDSSIPFDMFNAMYKKATQLPHSFFYVDSREDSFRRNFDCKFIIRSKEDDGEN